MSTVQEQLAALRAGTQLAPEQTEVASPTQEDELLTRIFELGLFDAIVPSPDGERIYEYEERRKRFNLIMHDFISEQINALTVVHEEVVEDLKSELSRTEDLFDKELNRAADLQMSLDKLQTDYAELKETYEKSKEEKKYEAPSESLKSRIASLRDLSADDMVARFEARQAAKNPVTTANDLQFRTETSEAQSGNYPIFPTVDIPKVEFPFQASGSEELLFDAERGEVVSQAIRDYVEKEIAKLAADNNLIY